jgi:hypothetical protein
MLSNLLTTNEIRNAAGTEVEFSRRGDYGPFGVEYFATSQGPSTPHTMRISHALSGSLLKARQRSVIRFDKRVQSTVDLITPVTISAYAVLDSPVGGLLANTEPTNVLAELMSFLASLGASTTILFDGTGNGAASMLNRTL